MLLRNFRARQRNLVFEVQFVAVIPIDIRTSHLEKFRLRKNAKWELFLPLEIGSDCPHADGMCVSEQTSGKSKYFLSA
jgi:hypothetical protein